MAEFQKSVSELLVSVSMCNVLDYFLNLGKWKRFLDQDDKLENKKEEVDHFKSGSDKHSKNEMILPDLKVLLDACLGTSVRMFLR